MIKELNGKYKFFQDDPLLEKYFFDKELTENERKKCSELYELVNNFCKKVYGKKSSYIGICYLDNYGYYELKDIDRGWFDLMPLGEDVNKVALYAVDEILFKNGFRYELENRERLKQEFDERFKDLSFEPNRGFHILHVTEYILSKWEIYYDGKLPEEIINKNESYMNNLWWTKEHHGKWEYDINTKKINFIKDKVKKL